MRETKVDVRRKKATVPDVSRETESEAFRMDGERLAASIQLAIRYRPLKQLIPYARNSRTHTAKQIAKIKVSLARFGWTNSLLIAGDVMVAGHARLQAALEMAEAGEPIAGNRDPWQAPTVDLSHLSETDRKAYVIADNRLAEDAGWDRDLLRLELTDLKEIGFDLAPLGFSLNELRPLLGEDNSVEKRQMRDGMVYQVLIECEGETDQASILEMLQEKGLKCRPLIL